MSPITIEHSTGTLGEDFQEAEAVIITTDSPRDAQRLDRRHQSLIVWTRPKGAMQQATGRTGRTTMGIVIPAHGPDPHLEGVAGAEEPGLPLAVPARIQVEQHCDPLAPSDLARTDVTPMLRLEVAGGFSLKEQVEETDRHRHLDQQHLASEA